MTARTDTAHSCLVAEPPVEYDLADAASAHAMLASRQAIRPMVLHLP